MSNGKLNITRHGGVVRLTMSAKVANDIRELKSGLASLAARMGHSTCASGCDILHLALEQEFSIGERVELNPQPLPPVAPDALILNLAKSDPMPGRTVLVTIPKAVSNDINSLVGAVEAAVGKLGCSPCCSGFDILFRNELDLIQIDEKLNVQGSGRFQ